jgi:DNA-binding CsgD family transcriptional regulator
MDRRRTISTAEARKLLRLANQLHEIHDPMSRKKHLIEGLCQLVDGAAGSCVVTHVDRKTSKPTLVSTTEYCAAEMPVDTPPSALHSSLSLRDTAVFAALRIFRSPLHGGDFTARHQLLVDLFHAEMTWVYQADVLLTSTSALSLSPRARQTLQHLLAGLSEKQIASRLRLSPNTVHHYVKSIHKHFGVSSRSELLARWVGK